MKGSLQKIYFPPNHLPTVGFNKLMLHSQVLSDIIAAVMTNAAPDYRRIDLARNCWEKASDKTLYMSNDAAKSSQIVRSK